MSVTTLHVIEPCRCNILSRDEEFRNSRHCRTCGEDINLVTHGSDGATYWRHDPIFRAKFLVSDV